MKAETVQNLILHLPHFGKRPAVGLRAEFAVRWWNYERLYQESLRFAGLLRARGARPGAKILLWAANSPEWAAALFGAVLRGLVVVPVDEGASEAYVRRLAEQVQPELIVHGPNQPAAFAEIPSLCLNEAQHELGADPTSDLIVPIASDDVVVIQFTSGTTGEPRGVLLTQRNLMVQINAFRRWRLLTRWLPVRMLCLSPLSHVQGLILGLLVPLSLGLSVLYSVSVEPSHVIRTVRQNQVALLLAVPRLQHLLATVLQELPYGRHGESLWKAAQKISFFPVRRHRLFLATHALLGYRFYVLLVGGADLSSEDERFWYECGYILVQGYGLTETTALVSVKVNGPFISDPGSIGRALSHQEVRLAPDGELQVRGPNVSPGIYHGSEAGFTNQTNGFLSTGDLASMDNEGQLYFRGRKDDLIVTAEGLNVYPADLEDTLRAIPGVRDAVVLKLEQANLQEVHACLLLDSQTHGQEVVAQANRRLETYQRIRSWSVWPQEDFPRVRLHKVRREMVAKRVPELLHNSTPPTQKMIPPTEHDLRAIGDGRARLELIVAYLRSVRDEPVLESKLSLVEDLGLSSLDIVELLSRLEQEWPRQEVQLTIRPDTTLADLHGALTGNAATTQPTSLPAHQPRWSGSFLGRGLRFITQPLLLGLWGIFANRVHSNWPHPLKDLEGPCIFAAAPHHHWLDGFVVYNALPRRWRRKLVTITNRDFHEWFMPNTGMSVSEQWMIGLAYYLLWPLVFEFAIVPNYGATRQGLYDLGCFLERGHSLIAFPKGLVPPGEDNPQHEAGYVAVALQAGVPIVPIWIEGNDHLQERSQRVNVRVGDPLAISPWMAVGDVVAQVEEAIQQLAPNNEGSE